MAVGVEQREERSTAIVWTVSFNDEPTEAPVNAARLAVVDGCLGTQAISEAQPSVKSAAAVRAAGIYGPEPPGLLVTAPTWTPVDWPATGRSWSLDLAAGQLEHRLVTEGGDITTTRFAIGGEPGCQAYVVPSWSTATLPTDTPESTVLDGVGGKKAAIVAVDWAGGSGLLRVVATSVAPLAEQAVSDARKRARRLVAEGSPALLERQRSTWADRWADCSVAIEGDATAEMRTRFALYRLLALMDHDDELSLGARGLTGAAYGGHVFWDTDVFVLPALASVAPTAARAVVEYRLRRLDAARRFAIDSGATGARYPWESAATGVDVTPHSAAGLGMESMAIRTGEQERHISADLVWAIQSYRRWTADEEILGSGAAETITEIARYLASEVEADGSGVGHIRGVIGPDEYHEDVTDNAFTNQMTAWALQQAVDLTTGRWAELATDRERRDWRLKGGSVEKGYRAELGRHLQFAGFDQLDPGLVDAVAEPPIAADLLLGREAVQRTQLIKQADVLMMHHLIPEELPPGSLAADLAYYLPRTTHGSSLSPAIHAAVLARAGQPDDALHWYRIALAIDLDDLTRTGAGGLHYANIGGIWQALLGGFLGVRATARGLIVSPALPKAWHRVHVRCLYRGTPVMVDAGHDRVDLMAAEPIPLMVADTPARPTTSAQLRRTEGRWRWHRDGW